MTKVLVAAFPSSRAPEPWSKGGGRGGDSLNESAFWGGGSEIRDFAISGFLFRISGSRDFGSLRFRDFGIW